MSMTSSISSPMHELSSALLASWMAESGTTLLDKTSDFTAASTASRATSS
jgi:hypothetical protein